MVINRFIPNIDDVAASRKESAWPDAVHFDVLKAAYNLNGILDGCAISDGSSGLEVDLAVGCVVIDGVAKTVAAQTVTLAAAHATLPRLDLITVNTSGVLVANVGVALAVPVYVPIPASEVVVGTVLVAAAATALTDDDINNTQINLNRQQFTMNRQTSTVTIVNTTDQLTLASYTIPGRALGTDGGVRMRFGGQILKTSSIANMFWELHLGGTKVLETGLTVPDADEDVRQYVCEVGFLNVASFSAQRLWLSAYISSPTPPDSNWSVLDTEDSKAAAGYGTAAKDTATDLLFDLQHKWSVAGGAISINRSWLSVERIPPS